MLKAILHYKLQWMSGCHLFSKGYAWSLEMPKLMLNVPVLWGWWLLLVDHFAVFVVSVVLVAVAVGLVMFCIFLFGRVALFGPKQFQTNTWATSTTLKNRSTEGKNAIIRGLGAGGQPPPQDKRTNDKIDNICMYFLLFLRLFHCCCLEVDTVVNFMLLWVFWCRGFCVCCCCFFVVFVLVFVLQCLSRSLDLLLITLPCCFCCCCGAYMFP